MSSPFGKKKVEAALNNKFLLNARDVSSRFFGLVKDLYQAKLSHIRLNKGIFMPTSFAKPNFDINAEISPLLHKLNAMVSFENGARVTFIAASPGEGTTTAALAFALALHREHGRRVLLVTNNGQARTGIVEAVTSGQDIQSALKQVDDGVFGGPWTASPEGRRQAGKIAQDGGFWKGLQSKFDVIVFDAPALQTASDGVGFAQISDTTVLVVAAESTRKQVVENLRDTLATAGAKIAGVVMNKRDFHIPENIYKNL